MVLAPGVPLGLPRRPAVQLWPLVLVEGLLAEWLKPWLVRVMPLERSVYEAAEVPVPVASVTLARRRKVARLSSVWRVEPAVFARWSRDVSFEFPERRPVVA